MPQRTYTKISEEIHKKSVRRYTKAAYEQFRTHTYSTTLQTAYRSEEQKERRIKRELGDIKKCLWAD